MQQITGSVIGKTAPSEKRHVCLPSGTEEANEPEMMYFSLLHKEFAPKSPNNYVLKGQ